MSSPAEVALGWIKGRRRPRIDELSVTSVARDPDRRFFTRVGEDITEIYPLPDDVIVEKDVRIPMSDGIEISVNVFRPRRPEPAPVIMALTSYDKDLGPDDYAINGRGAANRAIGLNLGSMRVSAETPWEAPDPGYWAPHGYAVVHVDARGTGKSTGVADVFGAKTVDDFCRVIEWGSDQPWSNGRVGTQGVSYLAIIQWLVAAKNPRGLAAINPWEGLTDQYRDAMIHGGIPETGFVRWWLGGRKGLQGTDAEPKFSNRPPLLSALPVKNPKLAMLLFARGGVPLVQDVDVPAPEVEDIAVPALVAASWSAQGLHTRGAFNGFMRLTSDKWLFTHGRHEWTVSNSAHALDYQRSFFDRFLKLDEHAMDDRPRVRLEVRQTAEEYSVREEDTWPLAGTEYTPMYLDAISGEMTTEKPKDAALCQYFSTRNDELTFRHRFVADTEITGHTALRLHVGMDEGNDMDIFVALRKRDPSDAPVEFWNHLGRFDIVSRGWLRLSHRKKDPQRSTPWRPFLTHDEPLPVVPGRQYAVDIEILPSSTLFEAGSELVLTIKGRDIDDNRVCQHKSLTNRGRHSVYTGGRFDSHLLLPVIVR